MSRAMYVSVSDIMQDPDQTTIYNLKKDKRYIVEGCAGSGKSSLALLLLQRILAEKGEDDNEQTPAYYVTTAHELVECVRSQFQFFDMDTPLRYNDYAITGGDAVGPDGKGSNWKMGMITDLQRKNQVPGGAYCINSRQIMLKPEVVKKEHNGSTRSFTNENIRVNKNPEFLLVDEAQDFNRKSIEEFLNSASKGCVFYGDDTQCIMGFAHPMHLTDIEALLKAKYGDSDANGRIVVYRYKLKRNWRLSKEIAAFAQELPNGVPDPVLLQRCRGEYHEKPILIQKDTELAMIEYMRLRCVKATLDDDVGIILRTNDEVRRVFSQLQGLGNVSARYNISRDDYAYLQNTPVKIMTYENAKGQQFRDVFLIGSEEILKDPDGLNRFYVGVTRAERFLRILYTGALPSFLQNIDPDLYNISE